MADAAAGSDGDGSDGEGSPAGGYEDDGGSDYSAAEEAASVAEAALAAVQSKGRGGAGQSGIAPPKLRFGTAPGGGGAPPPGAAAGGAVAGGVGRGRGLPAVPPARPPPADPRASVAASLAAFAVQRTPSARPRPVAASDTEDSGPDDAATRRRTSNKDKLEDEASESYMLRHKEGDADDEQDSTRWLAKSLMRMC